MSSRKTDNEATFLSELADINGVSCATTSDGHVLVFTERTLENLLERCKTSGKGKIVVFVKTEAKLN